jgi:hypothetical protein
MLLLLASAACIGEPAQASNPTPDTPPQVAEVQAEPKAAEPAPVEAGERRRSPANLTVFATASKSGRQRGIIAKDEPFRVLEHVAGPGCGGDGWARIEGNGFACLEKSEVTTDIPAKLPRLVAFDSPEPAEWADYVKTGSYTRDTLVEDQAFTPAIYGKPWRKWKGPMYPSVEAFVAGKQPIGFLPKDRKYHFVKSEETPKGTVLYREDGKVTPADQVFIYPIERNGGRDLEKEPVPEGRVLAWVFNYDGGHVHREPNAKSEVAVTLDYHAQLLLDATPADASGHWWRLPDALGPGVPGYLDDRTDVRHTSDVPPVTQVADDAVWIDVDRSQQMLSLMRGNTRIYATLVSTGDIGWATPTGIYRIYHKTIDADMSSRADNPEPYFVEDVPWTMHFKPRYALHGVFWHWGFGNIASHGCVNLAPKDASFIFSVTHPVLPDGWREINESKEDPGTTIRVRDGAVPAVDKRPKL